MRWYTRSRLELGRLLTLALSLVLLLPPVLPAGRAHAQGELPLPLDANAGWVEMGTGSATGVGISDNVGWSGSPSLAIAPDGMPYVAWHDPSGGPYQIYVRRWNGATWDEVGDGSASGRGISDTDGGSVSPSLGVAPDGIPYVAWTENDARGGQRDIYVRRWNGSSWEEVGLGSASGGGISDNDLASAWPSLAIAPDGTPYVAWEDTNRDPNEQRETFLRRWDRAAWVELGGSATGGGISANKGSSGPPSLAVAPDGTPYVAWSDSSFGNAEIYLRCWNGATWEEVGAGSATGGGISDDESPSYSPSIAIAGNGTPYVAWEDHGSGDSEIYVRRWNGASWEEVGAGSASGGGISDDDGRSTDASLAVAPDGTPYLAWSDESNGDNQIYVRRWNGISWEEVGQGSARGGGISSCGGSTGWVWPSPSIAVGADGTPYVAWEDLNEANWEIYVRQGDGTPPAAVTDLVASMGTLPGEVQLDWTAPGDDGSIGTPVTYTVRYAAQPITATNWVSSTDVSGEPQPSIAGSPENMTVSGLAPCQLYYFALKTQDDVPNMSGTSNSPSAWAYGTITGLAAQNDSPTELGETTMLSVTVSAGCDLTYTWTFGDGDTDSGQAVGHVYGSVGIHTATVTAANSADSVTATTHVTVADVPIFGLLAQNDSPTELGQTTTLTATVASGSNVTYTWSLGDGETGGGQVVGHGYPVVGLFTATVTATNGVGSLNATTLVSIIRSETLIYLPLLLRGS